MPHPLTQQVRAVRRRARQLVLVHGFGWWVALTLLVTFALGLVDYLVRFRNDGMRLVTFAAVTSFLAITFWRIVLPGLRQRTSDLEVAQLIERRFPQLQDRLSSSLAFLGESPQPSAMGSTTLQRSVVAETDQIVATLNVFDCLESHRARRAVVVLSLIALTTFAISTLDLPAARLASQRLLLPWSHADWPRRNQLEFVDPPQLLPRGNPFVVTIVDRNGRLPATANLEIKFAGSNKLHRRRVRKVKGRMVARLDDMRQAFEVRAVGGDDNTMSWHSVEVRERVRVTDVDIRVQPPDYTGLPLEKSSRLIRAWAGSSIRLEAQLDAPAEIVSIKSTVANVPDAQVAQDGRSFRVPPASSPPWVPTASGTFHFHIQDRDGLEVTSDIRLELILQEDTPPTVSWVTPLDNESFLREAEIPLRVVIKDDLRIHSATLVYQDQKWPLFDRATFDEPQLPVSPRREDEHVIDTTWDLKALQLQPGDEIEFYVAAEDGKPQVGTSPPRRLSIISADEFDDRLERNQAEFRRRVEKALTLQLGVFSHTELLATSTSETANTPDAEKLQAAHWGQQQIRQMISGTDGALLLADALAQRLTTNQAARPDIAARLHAAAQLLRTLDADALPASEHQLGIALKIAQTQGVAPTANERRESETATRSASQHQQRVINSLEAILERFAKWSNVRRIATDVQNMQRQQQKLVNDTEALQTVGKRRRDLTAEEAELLRQLVQRQAQLARQTDRMVQELEKLQRQVAEENPAFAEMLRRAFDAATQSNLAANAHDARRNLEENQIGNATSQQRKVQDGLRQVEDAITRRKGDLPEKLLDNIKIWLDRQQSLMTATQNHNLRYPEPEKTPDALRAAGGLANAQQQLADDIEAASPPHSSPVMQFIFDEIVQVMSRAARQLNRNATGPNVHNLQAAAHAQLVRLAQTLESTSPQPSETTPATGGPDPGQPAGQPSNKALDVADLKLLRDLQRDINRQTAEIEETRNDRNLLSAEQAERISELTLRQERLAKLVFSLIRNKPASDTPTRQDNTLPKTDSNLDDALRKANIPGFSED